MPASMVLTTFPDKHKAERASRRIIESKAAACANIIKVRSIYIWKGKIEEAEEFLVLLKTDGLKVGALKEMLEREHPYECPEVVEVSMKAANKKYLDWMKKSLS